MRIFVECYSDTELIRFLGVASRDVRHVGGKGKVIQQVRDQADAAGLIDEDPRSPQPRDLRNYQIEKTAFGLNFLERNSADRKRLVVVCPRLEDWIITRAAAAGLKLAKYSLPDDPSELHKIRIHTEPHRSNFRSLLQDLGNKDGSLQTISDWLIPNRSTQY